ncbi:MAG: peptidoglycan editing factor PgeF [Desulfobacterales bacterium]
MFLCRKNKLVYAAFSNLAALPGIFHGMFTRLEGQHPGSGDNLNVGANSGNPSAAVESSRRAIAGCMDDAELVFLNQVHGKDVAVIKTDRDLERAVKSPPTADAVITKIPEAGLAIQTADCQSVMLCDPVRGVAANIHSGWRGSISNIIGACIDTMEREFAVDPADLSGGIGPSLGPCCAEFVHFRQEIPESFWKYKDDKDRFDFWQISRDQLRAAGVKPENVECAHVCTKCNTHLFYSYRREGSTGRFAAIVGLKRKQQP